MKLPASVLAIIYSVVVTLLAQTASAHHVLGRPSYSLNEDSNTPPHLQVETLIGNLHVTYMVYPAFPKPGEAGRVHLYVKHRETGEPFDGEITFSVQDDGWLQTNTAEVLGAQVLDDGIYRQGFVFAEDGAYLISANFHYAGEPYRIDFPLRVGSPPLLGPLGIFFMAIASLLVSVGLYRRRQTRQQLIRQHHLETRT